MSAVVCSGRPEVARSAAEELDRVMAAFPAADPDGREEGTAPHLVVLDLGSEGVSIPEARRSLGPDRRIVALVDGDSADRLISALADGCCDYLFYPINRDELRLLWRRQVEGDVDPVLFPGSLERGRLRLQFPSDVRYVRAVVERVVEGCRGLSGVGRDAAFRLRVALGEALANAILYGNREDPTRRVTVEAEAEEGTLRVSVSDEGEGFDPSAVPDPRRSENRDRAHGRGLFLLRSLMHEVRHNRVGNRVTLVMRTSAGEPRPSSDDGEGA